MGFRLAIAPETGSARWSLTLEVTLSRAESNALFLSGDSILSWPLEGLVHAEEKGQSAGLERTSMFVSEVAARAPGLRLVYGQRPQAEQAADVLRAQLLRAELSEEAG